MRVVLLPAVAGRETGQIMTNSRKRHTPEQVVRKLGQADRMLADGQDVVMALIGFPQSCSVNFPGSRG